MKFVSCLRISEVAYDRNAEISDADIADAGSS